MEGIASLEYGAKIAGGRNSHGVERDPDRIGNAVHHAEIGNRDRRLNHGARAHLFGKRPARLIEYATIFVPECIGVCQQDIFVFYSRFERPIGNALEFIVLCLRLTALPEQHHVGGGSIEALI